ncbi:MAG: hypothetical protein EHM28_04855, partial [Spirochaetaceae bacterium]
ARVSEIASMLSDKLLFSEYNISNRAVWEKLALSDDGRKIIATAVTYESEQLPQLTSDLFLEYSRTGNRSNWDSAVSKAHRSFRYAVLAECMENKGNHLVRIGAVINLFCSLPTWVKSAHDSRLVNFNRLVTEIDLDSSSLAWEFSIADAFLGDKLDQGLRDRLRQNITERVLLPYLRMAGGQQAENSWLRATHNWNAVCHAGVIGAALTLLPSKTERAAAIAAVEKYMAFYISGFADDGYCTEGVGYWNYGFGHFVLLSEAVRISTGNRLDLLAGGDRSADLDAAKIKRIAQYGLEIEIAPGVAPAFADTDINTVPDRLVQIFLARRFSLPIHQAGLARTDKMSGSLQEAVYFLLEDSRPSEPLPETIPFPHKTYFNRQGIMVLRHVSKSNILFGAALKSGNNNEHHNHNDVGSYTVVTGFDPVLADPGAEVYTARTFSSSRYESRVLSSWGHPVPVVAGCLQETGPAAAGKVISATGSGPEEIFTIDLTSCYTVPSLQALTREWRFSRKDDGELSVTDTVNFSRPERFETAVIASGEVKRLSSDTLLVLGTSGALTVSVNTHGIPSNIRIETINEDMRSRHTPYRIGITLDGPVTSAVVTVTIKPSFPQTDSLLPNGGFELGAWNWAIPAASMGRITGEKSFSGSQALLVEDSSTTTGSSISSSRIIVLPNKRYSLSGRFMAIAGSGCGIYFKFYDSEGNPVSETEIQKNILPQEKPAGSQLSWESFSLEAAAPEKAQFLVIWIHSYNSAKTSLYLDDFVLTVK